MKRNMTRKFEFWTPEKHARAVKLLAGGMFQQEVADALGCTVGRLQRHLYGKTAKDKQKRQQLARTTLPAAPANTQPAQHIVMISEPASSDYRTWPLVDGAYTRIVRAIDAPVKPWEQAGMSRAAWYRAGRPLPEAAA